MSEWESKWASESECKCAHVKERERMRESEPGESSWGGHSTHNCTQSGWSSPHIRKVTSVEFSKICASHWPSTAWNGRKCVCECERERDSDSDRVRGRRKRKYKRKKWKSDEAGLKRKGFRKRKITMKKAIKILHIQHRTNFFIQLTSSKCIPSPFRSWTDPPLGTNAQKRKIPPPKSPRDTQRRHTHISILVGWFGWRPKGQIWCQSPSLRPRSTLASTSLWCCVCVEGWEMENANSSLSCPLVLFSPLSFFPSPHLAGGTKPTRMHAYKETPHPHPHPSPTLQREGEGRTPRRRWWRGQRETRLSLQ